jgi:Holliday junction resolvase
MRRKARTDTNHAEISQAFRQLGWSVVDCSRAGSGFPDLLVAKNGVMKLVEVKDGLKPPSARKLTEDEAAFHQRMLAAGCPVVIVLSLEDVAAL